MSTDTLDTATPSLGEFVDVTGAPLPSEWQKLAEQAGIRATHRGIAEAAGVWPATVTRLISKGRTSPETVKAVADALRVDQKRIRELAHIPQSEDGPWEPPDEAQWLSRKQRDALNDLIIAIVSDDRAEQKPERERSPAADRIGRALAKRAQDDESREEPPQDHRRAQ